MAAPQLAPFDTAASTFIASGIVHMEKILLPVDFSEPCLRVVLHAPKFACYFGSEVSLLHVQPATENSARERLESFGRPYADAFLGRIHTEVDGLLSHGEFLIGKLRLPW